MFFDSHCHLTADTLRDDFEATLSRAREAGVTHILNIGDTLASSEAAIAQCAKSSLWMRAAAGVHPQNALEWNEGAEDALRLLAAHTAVDAIGEIGLDWVYDETHPHYPGATRDRQREVFRAQLLMARDLNKPVVIHNRDADEAIIDVIASVPGTHGVIHCWAGSLEAAQRALDLGLHLGFTGLATFKNAALVHQAVALCPLDRLLIETDAPYLAPMPHRGQRNEPSYLPHTARAVAAIKGIPLEQLAMATTANAIALFG